MAVLKSLGLLLTLFFLIITSGSWLNSPPEIEVKNHYRIEADSSLHIAFKVNDPDGDTVNVSVDQLPNWMTFDADELTLKGKPELWDKGHYEINLQANDGKAQRDKWINLSVEIPLSPEDLLHSKLKELYQTETNGLLGVSAALVTPEGTLITAHEGRKSAQSREAIDVNTQYRIASITKTFTAVLCLKLVEAELIDLDDPMSKYIEVGRIPYGKKITIRQLLNHTSGLIDHLNRSDFYTGNWQTRQWSSADIIRYTSRRRSRFVPGTNYAYSNTGYYFLGNIIESVTQKSLAESFESWIFSPLGLDDTFYDDYSTNKNKIQGLAENRRSYEYHLSAVGTAGAIVSTPADVARFGAFVYDGSFLPEYIKKEMVVDYTTHLGGDEYGLGTRMWMDFDIYHIGHTGTLMDYRSVLMYIPEKKVTLALSTNQRHRKWYNLVNNLLRDVYWYY